MVKKSEGHRNKQAKKRQGKWSRAARGSHLVDRALVKVFDKRQRVAGGPRCREV
jgi:hypothetical protein